MFLDEPGDEPGDGQLDIGPSEEGIRGLGISTTRVTDLFFSPRNIAGLQDALRYQCYLETGAVIGRQSGAELLIIMRRVLEEGEQACGGVGAFEASRRPAGAAGAAGGEGVSDVTLELMALNERTLALAVPEVVGALRSHSHYLQDISKPVAVPLPYSQYMGSRNTGSALQFPGLS